MRSTRIALDRLHPKRLDIRPRSPGSVALTLDVHPKAQRKKIIVNFSSNEAWRERYRSVNGSATVAVRPSLPVAVKTTS